MSIIEGHIIEVRVPQLSESVSEATLLTWHKQAGEAVAEGENLIDVETDKVVLELPASKSGVLTRIIKGNGEKVASEEVIAQIDTAAQAQNTPSPLAGEGGGEGEKKPAPAVPPSVRKLAREHEIDAGSLQGSGRSGRDTTAAVLNALPDAKSTTIPPPTPPLKGGENAAAPTIHPPLQGEGWGGDGVNSARVAGSRPEQRVPMTRIRQRIAERLLQSQQNAAILTTFNEVNMQPVIDLRNKYMEAFEKKHGVKLGFSSFFVRAAVLALQKFPVVNASV
ncbi:MAG: 2-oxo acid dehydrogenase subunit E2, partial [Sulfuricaulis sp.]|nr:2-oxo acid dehydrogenase subunit E2 [Sulfuricaulis sp.]